MVWYRKPPPPAPMAPDPAEVAPGERIVTTLARGRLRSLVVGTSGAQASLFEDEGTGDRGPGTVIPTQELQRTAKNPRPKDEE